MAGASATGAAHRVSGGIAASPTRLEPRAGDARLAAIVHLDVVGYSRMTALDEAGTFARLQVIYGRLLPAHVALAGGRIVDTAGDSALLVFPSAHAAVCFALNFQQMMAERERQARPDRAMRFRAGVTVADVLDADGHVHGDGVNIAARLQAACPTGGVCIAASVREQVQASWRRASSGWGRCG